MSSRPIKTLLIANRGEIALRIIRTARVLGIRTVAVYSEADVHAAHVLAADDAYPIGPPEPALSYLNATTIIAAAREAGADAIHPGYGFLSERAEFARAVTDAGLIFVGPPAEVMAALGDKVAARRLATKSEVPVVPGIETADAASARRFAAQVGYPILVKAAAGGGGRGMRVVEDDASLEAALEAAAREAQAAFGDGRIFIEKYLAHPRHIEIQLLADHHGTVVALGERECSIQRRHQKIIEESPAPGLSPALRDRMADAALRLARSAGYRNAGTAEFLVDGENFYFLEVNARLQVEHPVTELRFGCDLVAEQLHIAAGDRLTPPLEPRGCAIECRINAEDAEHDFRPATGRVAALALPSGPGVRVDTHLTAGAEVPPYYDSLIAKLITFGADREMARKRMAAALDDFSVLGVAHTGAFLQAVIASEPFARAQLSTRFLPEYFPHWSPSEQELKDAVLAAFLLSEGLLNTGGAVEVPRNGAGERSGASSRSPGRTGGLHDRRPPMKLKRPGETQVFDVAMASRTNGVLRVSLDGEEFDVTVEPAADGVSLLRIGDRRLQIHAARARNALLVAAGSSSFTFVEAEAHTSTARRGSATPEMAAPMPGKVLKILVNEGQAVAAGDALIVLEAMKMETTLFAEGAAVIRKIRVETGQMVDHGAVLLELSPAAGSSTSESPIPNP